jgi:hypothetical protein
MAMQMMHDGPDELQVPSIHHLTPTQQKADDPIINRSRNQKKKKPPSARTNQLHYRMYSNHKNSRRLFF